MRALVGFSGFVGQHLLEQTNFDKIYRSSNISSIRGHEFETIVCAGVPAVKWLANENPGEDRAILEDLLSHLKTTRTGRFVLVSTIDVYSSLSSRADEEGTVTSEFNHAYGRHRLWFEEQVKHVFPTHHIVRLPALFGNYMKKNYIFDLLHNRTEFIQKIDMNSSFQWYNMDHLWRDISRVIENDLNSMNLFTEPLPTRTIMHEVFPQHVHLCESNQPNSSVNALQYNLCTKHSELWNWRDGYIASLSQVLQELKSFVKSYQPLVISKKLCISNIAWDSEENSTILQFLDMKGISKLEVAPTKIIDTWDMCEDASAADTIQRTLKNFQVESLQSVLFNKPNLELFGTQQVREELRAHTMKVIDLASNLGARVIVWGSPKQRLTQGRPYEECFELARRFFKTIGDYAHEKNVTIGFEANAREYGCDFCYTALQAAELVRATASVGFRLHLDTANMHLENDDFDSILKAHEDILCHIQVSEPFLTGFNAPSVNHSMFAQHLSRIRYTGALSIEMRRQDETLRSIALAVAFTMKTYYGLL